WDRGSGRWCRGRRGWAGWSGCVRDHPYSVTLSRGLDGEASTALRRGGPPTSRTERDDSAKVMAEGRHLCCRVRRSAFLIPQSGLQKKELFLHRNAFLTARRIALGARRTRRYSRKSCLTRHRFASSPQRTASPGPPRSEAPRVGK